jgi:ATP-dependent DNA helicase RecG
MRPELLNPAFTEVTRLKGCGPKLAAAIERLTGGRRLLDLWFHLPTGLIDRRAMPSIAAAPPGQVATLTVTVERHIEPAGPRQPHRVLVADDSGSLTLVFFHGPRDHLLQILPENAVRVVSGTVELYGDRKQMTHPDRIGSFAEREAIATLDPVYPLTGGLTKGPLQRAIGQALERLPDLPEWHDPALLARESWPSFTAALRLLHHLADATLIRPESPARRRLAYDELLANQLALALVRANARRQSGRPLTGDGGIRARLAAALPYVLTPSQTAAIAEIAADLAAETRMARLLQGDVGAGKTVVAMLAMADVAAAGLQSALMAPTEILARQHYKTMAAPLEAQGLTVVLLTGRDKGAVRAEKLKALADGSAAVAVGTHALFQDDVRFKSLAFTVIDEQHRFGVSERRRLQDKGEAAHLLAMSATPIPRTLELTVYGDLEVSRIDEKPPGRKPVATRAAPMPRLAEVVTRLRQAVAGGAQAFWICPLVAESEISDLAAAEARAGALRKVFGTQVGLIHGRLPPAEKDAVMQDFADGRLSVLVATTVVEVGVDVPNASIMVIEQAERFGLAQLHQLRGRVGRGARESSCVLLYDPPLTQNGQARLDVLRRTDDGFEIAEKDLELRGGGDPLGLRQSGFPAYRFADPIAHRDLIAVAADDARLILSRDPALTSPRGKALQVLQALFDWRGEAPESDAG